MDSEMFSTEPYYGGEPDSQEQSDYLRKHEGSFARYKGLTLSVQDAKPFHMYYAAYRTGHVFKMLCYMLMVLTVLLIFNQFVEVTKAIPSVGIAWNRLLGKKPFTQKENLQWLGASANVIRGDYENKTDSLAEKAAKQAGAVTDMSAPLPKATFLSPEEELSKKQRQ